jgi:hypothetical protein
MPPLDLDGGQQDAPPVDCVDPPPPPGGDPGLTVTFSPLYEPLYDVFDLGPVPGIPPGHLGGCVIKHDDPNTMLIAGESETPNGAIYAVPLKRDACGHIIGFDGIATLVAQTPYVDANLVYGANNILLYPQWPVNQLSQLLPGQTQPSSTIDLTALGVAGGSISGLGFVPPTLPAGGGSRALTWSEGFWYHLTLGFDGQLYTVSSPQQTTTLPNGPGGFAYVPVGSPGFTKPSLIVAEWSVDKVATYEVDDQGDPIVATRQDFFTAFPRPWGAYFEPETGDFVFLTWGPAPDRVYVVQGFTVPPPPPPPPR